MSRIEQADKERRNIEAGAPPERLSKDFIIFQQSQQIAELVESLEEMIYSNSTKHREKAMALVLNSRHSRRQ